MYRLLAFGIFAMTTVSCKQEIANECAGIPIPTVSTNSPIESGQDLQLSISNIRSAQTFSWKGPDGFSSNEQNPLIRKAQSINAGKYTVKVTLAEGCSVSAVTDSAIVSVPLAPCAPANNTANISGAGSLSFTGSTGIATGGSYFVEANGVNGSVVLEFPGLVRPVSGIYSIQPLSGQWLKGDVRLRLTAQSSNWPSSNGKVYVSSNNMNKIIITFCNVPVSAQTFVFNSTASGKITER